MIDLELTPKIKEWLETEPSQRSLHEGADLLLRVTRNRILYANVTRNLARHAGTIEYHLNKIYKNRLADITHSQVSSMLSEVDAIARAHGLGNTQGLTGRTELQRGKRADHDELPDEIRQLYLDNAEIHRKIRECHLQIRMITPENSTCPDSDRYPWAKEIIALDTLYRENWNRYDHYIKGTPPASVQLVTDPRSESRNAARVIHLLLGKYDPANPDDALADRIRATYAKIDSPTVTIREKMAAAGLI
ncbi:MULTISPECIES: hypothetical protein [Duncaniella]|uniref:Uncharacterized protein n=1 Tax=Duncaniella dubosii TaxID=2518971 RepID=A0A4P7W2J4_9BACT|nr:MULTISPECIES: hypothetical protein [Duncaniella]MBJ2190570.1 hypothetical protein [Muribaculaceae bacterium]MCX4285344.1 hypothetical protein [Duncaniella dubosii]QCD42176.1 hypothetical protein E7747_07755 [Duncaniella dubosii]HBN63034.1 hypothetical protein [Porphyromonadaceae bacterium]